MKRPVMVVIGVALGVAAVAAAGMVRHQAARSDRSSSGSVAETIEESGAGETATSLKVLHGAIRQVTGSWMVVEPYGALGPTYVFELGSAMIRVGAGEGSARDLKRGDVVGVLYTERRGKRVAKMVLLAPPGDTRSRVTTGPCRWQAGTGGRMCA